MGKRAAIYVRVSKAYREDDERVTIESQLQDCEEYCQKHGYTVVGRYIDKDKYRSRGKLVNPSGTRKDRPAYLKLLKDAKEGEFDVIVAWKEDRLYRGMYAALPLSEVLEEQRALSVELVTETFDTKMLGIKAAIAKLELDNIRDRMVRGRRARIERGEIPGGAIRYGYLKGDDKLLEINEEETKVVRQVIDWYIQGEHNLEIRRRLDALEIAPRASKKWSKAMIQNILNFEGYATGEYTTTLDGEPFTIHCPPIISLDTWEKSLEVRAGNKLYRGRNVKEDYLCRGLIVCLCGWKWIARTCKGRYQNGKWGYYGCSKTGNKPDEIHPKCPGTIGSKKLDDFVWNFVVNICRNPQIIHEAIDEKIRILELDHQAMLDEVDRLQNELDNIQSERQWVITQARKGRISDEDMDMQLGALHFQALDLKKKHGEMQAALTAKSQAESLKQWAAGYLKDIERGIDTLQTDPRDLSEADRAKLYDALEARRFEEKFEGDRLAALRWAILEEKRRMVRALIDHILVVKGENNEKLIIPKLVLEIPAEFASLYYDHQSLDYIEAWRKDKIVKPV
jgi:site-specific DNA recombinase